MSVNTSRINQASAYTLVELLVVIGVLSIVFSILFVGFGSGDGAKLSSAQRTLSGLVKAARGQAILKNAKVRLISHNDSDEVDKFRRFFGIIYDENPNPIVESWVASGKGTYLPKGIYFDADSSATNSDLNGANWTIANNTMRINFPRLSGQTGNNGTSHLFYEFNDNGTFSDPNAYLVFGSGRFIPGSAEPDFPAAKANIKSALILRPAGAATPVGDPNDIQ